VEQSVDNPFMIAAAPCPVWLIVSCSFFDQFITDNHEPDQRLRSHVASGSELKFQQQLGQHYPLNP
jgi:hypothetical protein